MTWNWKNILLITTDVLLGVYLVLAMTAFNKPDETEYICNNIRINIAQDPNERFLNERDITQLLRNSGLTLLAQPMSLINTRQIEEILQKHDLIDDAQCYKAINGSLCININQRIPVVRIMSNNGEDYYVDDNCEIIRHNNYACNLIVATGNISKQYASKKLAPMAMQIRHDKFWKNQVVQLNVLDDGSVELIPRVGEHVAYIGQPTEVVNKLDRLRKFYRYGLNAAGWNRYSRINVEFDNQIICTRRKLRN